MSQTFNALYTHLQWTGHSLNTHIVSHINISGGSVQSNTNESYDNKSDTPLALPSFNSFTLICFVTDYCTRLTEFIIYIYKYF